MQNEIKYPKPKDLHPVVEIAGYVWFCILIIAMMYSWPVWEELLK